MLNEPDPFDRDGYWGDFDQKLDRSWIDPETDRDNRFMRRYAIVWMLATVIVCVVCLALAFVGRP